KRRARMKMDRFNCDGWLHITADDTDTNIVTVRMTHHRCHTPYLDISIPQAVKDTVESLKHLTAAKVHNWSPERAVSLTFICASRFGRPC
ncbi:hypothetical protein DFH09DRAFT_906413, partial [Mycena vulgaris]